MCFTAVPWMILLLSRNTPSEGSPDSSTSWLNSRNRLTWTLGHWSVATALIRYETIAIHSSIRYGPIQGVLSFRYFCILWRGLCTPSLDVRNYSQPLVSACYTIFLRSSGVGKKFSAPLHVAVRDGFWVPIVLTAIGATWFFDLLQHRSRRSPLWARLYKV